MMSLESIRAISREQAAKAKRQHKEPFMVEREDLQDWKVKIEHGGLPRLPFPFLGDYVPKGWRKTDNTYFVDKSGWGADDEPALTVPKFINALREGFAYAIIEEGQFQLYVQEYTKGATQVAA